MTDHDTALMHLDHIQASAMVVARLGHVAGGDVAVWAEGTLILRKVEALRELLGPGHTGGPAGMRAVASRGQTWHEPGLRSEFHLVEESDRVNGKPALKSSAGLPE